MVLNRKITPESTPEPPDIGDKDGKYTLVALGDDRPDQWAPWLEEFIKEYQNLSDISIRADMEEDDDVPMDYLDRDKAAMELAEGLGVGFSSEFWEGNFINGHFYKGWIKTRSIGPAKRLGSQIIKTKKHKLVKYIIKKINAKLEKINNPEELVNILLYGASELLQEERQIRKELWNSRETLERNIKDAVLSLAHEKQMTRIANRCMQFALVLMDPMHSLALCGPLVWSNGKLFALIRQGNVCLPESPYLDLIRTAEAAGIRIVRVEDHTQIGASPFSGNRFWLNGSADPVQWNDIWRTIVHVPRNLTTDDPETTKEAMAIHMTISSDGNACMHL